uniref:Stress-activated protein kinase JNK n=1 Tax=Globodera rostochiensis TaxID=31243 RepID=A0A914I7C2_GLORO
MASIWCRIGNIKSKQKAAFSKKKQHRPFKKLLKQHIAGHLNNIFGSVQQWFSTSATARVVSSDEAFCPSFEQSALSPTFVYQNHMNSISQGPLEPSSMMNNADNNLQNFREVIFNETVLKLLRRYEFNASIGSGAQGLVICCNDLLTKQRVAIKRLTRPFANVIHAKRAYREFEIMNLVNHRNIIKLLNAYTPQSSLDEFSDIYLVMECMDANLCSVVQMGLDHERLSFLLYQMLCGINHLHKAGIIHRDLKPSNIVVDMNCQLKILDFGLARNSGENMLMTPYVVTRYYRAPEVVLGNGYTTTVDVWSIGCIFGELIRKEVLFRGSDHVDQWTKIVSVLGTPSIEFTARLQLTVRQYVESRPRIEARSWQQIFPDISFPPDFVKERVKLDALLARALLAQMLVIDPNNRISVQDALKHPYVNLWYDSGEVDGPAPVPYNEPIHGANLNVEQWKELIYHQIKDYERTHDIFGNSNAAMNGSGSDEMLDEI